MDKGLWVVDETVTHMTAYRLATQAEIDAAASEQLHEDAAVGKALRYAVVSKAAGGLPTVIVECPRCKTRFYAGSEDFIPCLSDPTDILLAEITVLRHRIYSLEAERAAHAAQRKDAAVGRALRTMPDVKITFSLTNFEGQVDFICTVQTQGAPSYHVYIKPTPYECLVAAGLVEEEEK